MPVRHNTKEFIAGIQRREHIMKSNVARIADKAGILMRDAIKDEIPPNNNGVSSWPGWEAKGTLKSQVVHSKPTLARTQYTSTVYMRLNSNTRKYFMVHEDGMEIHAKTPRGMRFYSIPHGRVITRHVVTIKPKHYWANGVEQGKRKIREMLRTEAAKILKEG